MTARSLNEMRPATRLVHGGVQRTPSWRNRGSVCFSPPVMFTTTPNRPRQTSRRNGTEHYQYSPLRQSDPDHAGATALCLIEGRRGTAAPRPPAWPAVNAALLSHLKAGDRVVASRALFGSCHWIVSTLLPKFGIARHEFVDGADLDPVESRPGAPHQPRAAGDAIQSDARAGRPARRLPNLRRMRRALSSWWTTFSPPPLCCSSRSS